MKRTDGLSKSLAIIGTLLLWAPILAPIALTNWMALGTERFNFDWLLPAEMLPVVVLGAGLLLWAAYRAQERVGLVAWGLAAVVGSIVVGSILANVTGLASGATEPVGTPLVIVSSAFVIYAVAVVELGVSGIMLLRDLFAHHGEQAPPAIPAM